MAGDEEAVTLWLQKAASGDAQAAERVASWAYAQLEQIAASRMRRKFGGRDVTLEPAALVNETFLKLLEHPVGFNSRRHYFGFVNKVMLNVLIDYQRARGAGKRNAQGPRVTLAAVGATDEAVDIDVLALEQALARLEALDPRKAEVAKLRTLWGLSMSEIAELVAVSEPTVRRDWRFAKAWLAEALEL